MQGKKKGWRIANLAYERLGLPFVRMHCQDLRICKATNHIIEGLPFFNDSLTGTATSAFTNITSASAPIGNIRKRTWRCISAVIIIDRSNLRSFTATLLKRHSTNSCRKNTATATLTFRIVFLFIALVFLYIKKDYRKNFSRPSGAWNHAAVS